jgi:translocation and assembly module TamB
VGVVDNLRRRAGLDNLDLTADGMGSAELTFGKYLAENAYTEVTLDQGGKSSISINLDLAPHVTLKGQLDSDGQTGIGLFLQRNY